MTLLSRKALAAAAVALSLSIGGTTAASAEPLFPVEDLGLPLDSLGRPKQEILDAAKDFAQKLPEQQREQLLAAIRFYEGPSKSNTLLPENAPEFTQFFWPVVAGKCIDGKFNSTGTAIAVAGPAPIPAPKPGVGEATFVFTALGTRPLAGEQNMNVHWFNLDTLKGGTTKLGDHGINPQGPSTVSGKAETGHGRIVALLEGTVGTQDGPCNYFPTTAAFAVK